MKIGDRVEISEPKHPLFNYIGFIVGFRGKKGPDDEWLLILVERRGRSYLIPRSMVNLISDSGDSKNYPVY